MTAPHNRIALVTGAGSGIGRATAHRLIEDGWRVVFAGRRLEALREAIAAAGDPFGDIDQRAIAAPADLTRPDSVAALFDVVRARFGRLDMLFNNAGTGAPPVPLEELTVEQWRTVVDTNLTGRVPVHPAGLPHHEGAVAEGRTHHQQRLDLGLRAAAALGALHRHQACGQRADALGLARRAGARHRGRPDRHRQCRNRHDRSA